MYSLIIKTVNKSNEHKYKSIYLSKFKLKERTQMDERTNFIVHLTNYLVRVYSFMFLNVLNK